MKKILVFLTLIILVFSLVLVGCGDDTGNKPSDNGSTSSTGADDLTRDSSTSSTNNVDGNGIIGDNENNSDRNDGSLGDDIRDDLTDDDNMLEDASERASNMVD